MAVTAVCEIGQSNSVSQTLPYTEEITAAWKVTAQADDEALVVRGQAQESPFNLPKLNDLYSRTNESSVRSRAQRINVTRMSDRPVGADKSYWLYQVTYGNKSGQGNKEPPPGDPLPGDENPEPTDRPMRYWVEFQSFQERMDKDTAGTEVTNSAGLRFTDPPPTRDASRLVQVVQKNFPGNTFTEYKAIVTMCQTLQLKSNSVEWFGHAVDHVLMLPPQVSPPRFENDKLFYEVQFRGVVFTSPTDEILLAPLDLGTGEVVTIRSGDADERKVAREATDGLNAYTGVIKLDGAGKIMKDQTQPAVALDGQGGRKGPFRRYAQTDFNAFIPTPT